MSSIHGNGRWSAPGTVLLAGEYRVAEEGGLGIALAAGGRAHLQHANKLIANKHNGVIESVCRALNLSPQNKAEVSIDTSAFYTLDGKKWGLGSSAAVSLLLSRYLSDGDVLKMALNAHRDFQGGLGSGYDVYAAYHGGVGFFTGGLNPSWEPICWPQGIMGYLLRGASPVASPAALMHYRCWAAEYRDKAAAFRKRSDEAVMALRRQLASGGTESFSLIRELSRLSVALGESIGIPARPHIPKELNIREGADVVLKCVGAGDELVLMLFRKGSLPLSEIEELDNLAGQGKARRLDIERQGLRNEFDPFSSESIEDKLAGYYSSERSGSS